MLRITKSTPGVLDLSAVKDEHGVPVTLNGVSHRDVPDHEENNPVLQRIVELRWVSVSPVPLGVVDDLPVSTSAGAEDTEVPPAPLDTEHPSALAETNDVAPDVQGPAPDNTEPTPDETLLDAPAKFESSGKSYGKSDTRKAGRRS